MVVGGERVANGIPPREGQLGDLLGTLWKPFLLEPEFGLKCCGFRVSAARLWLPGMMSVSKVEGDCELLKNQCRAMA